MEKITIRAVTKNKKKAWLFDRIEQGKRKRTFHTSKAAALAHADEVRAQKQAMGDAWLSLPVCERNRLMDIWLRAKERGIDLEALVRNSEPSVSCEPITLGSAIEKLIEHGRQGGRTERYLYKLQAPLDSFAHGRQALKLSAISPADVTAWLSGRTQWTRSTYRARLSGLFRFAIHQGWIARNPVERVAHVRIVMTTPKIFSCTQHGLVLQHLVRNPQGLAWYILTCLCGLRPEEAGLTQWKDIDLDAEAPLIRIEAQTSKLRQRRIVYPHPTAIAWLRFARQKKTQLPLSNEELRRKIRRALRSKIGWETWPQDITRHTAASYWLAERQDAAAIAECLGHSVEMLKRHYRAVVTRDEAARFWAITPESLTASNAVAVDFKASAPGKSAVG